MSKKPVERPEGLEETDHEFRTRMAAEGRAIYVPGKSLDEIAERRASEEAARNAPRRLVIELTEEQISALDLALPDACELIWDAGHIFRLVESGITSGFMQPDDAGILSLLRVASRAMMQTEEHEIALLGMLDQKIRRAASDAQKEAAA